MSSTHIPTVQSLYNNDHYNSIGTANFKQDFAHLEKPNSLQHGLHIKVNVKTARPLKTDFEVKQMTHRVCLRLNKIFKEE